ncbi:hypothetical protein NLS1_21510 [Nocardioides sp. LS1]|nr:hypothetical protein NLS1_21510 [Nocardioides sp. LS1]
MSVRGWDKEVETITDSLSIMSVRTGHRVGWVLDLPAGGEPPGLTDVGSTRSNRPPREAGTSKDQKATGAQDFEDLPVN